MVQEEEIRKGVLTGFVNGSIPSNPSYQPKLLLNSRTKETKVLSTLINELEKCDEFFFSVAFVTNSGVATLINTLKELEYKGVRGKIVVSQYQNFTEPRALTRLIQLKNLEVRIMVEGNLHSKGYIFKNRDSYTLIVGSSNLTADALCSNNEWNLKVSSTDKGSIVPETLREFLKLFEASTPVTPEWIAQYEKIYQEKDFIIQKADEIEETGSFIYPSISPNRMQQRALEGIERLREAGENKALLISATGTGKTYLSAFDVKKVNPKKFLFVIHREKIARDALKSYKKVLGPGTRMGILTGNKKTVDADFIFATIQTLAKQDTLHSFAPDYFDYIVIDEVHHAGASTYQLILNYFKPKFLLGMTATPERTDGFDIFGAFNYNIAYEIRLNDALEEHMLSPFHYYGVTDLLINNEIVDDKTEFNKLVGEERVKRIIEYARFYGCDRGRVKGLIFCSRKDEASELSSLLNGYGLKTIALTGSSSEAEREGAIQKLESDEYNHLDYILTVDIFNEGIDIPSINQIIMLRPTMSAIVFVQQLGRGLRIADDKEYLTVIDFIGNYNNNYLVPIALYGDNSYNKDTLRKLMSGGSSMIPGSSSINFDRISKQKIYDSINSAVVDSFRALRDDFQLLMFKLGRVPTMVDFVEHGSRDPYAYVDKYGSLYAFYLEKIRKEPIEPFADNLGFFLREACDGVRLEEPVLLKMMIDQESVSFDSLAAVFENEYKVPSKKESFISAVRFINGQFHSKDAGEPYLTISNNLIVRGERFAKLLQSDIFTSHLRDGVEYAIRKFMGAYTPETYFDGFLLYEKYSRKDVCRVMNWDKDEHSTMYGYRIKHNTCPIFVTYSKSEDISESTKYEDYFINNMLFHWMTRTNVRIDSRETMEIKHSRETGLRISLFVKKSDAEDSKFYYMGDMTPMEKEFHETVKDCGNGVTRPIMNINFEMNIPVADTLYKYLHEGITKEEDEAWSVEPHAEDKDYFAKVSSRPVYAVTEERPEYKKEN